MPRSGLERRLPVDEGVRASCACYHVRCYRPGPITTSRLPVPRHPPYPLAAMGRVWWPAVVDTRRSDPLATPPVRLHRHKSVRSAAFPGGHRILPGGGDLLKGNRAGRRPRSGWIRRGALAPLTGSPPAALRPIGPAAGGQPPCRPDPHPQQGTAQITAEISSKATGRNSFTRGMAVLG